MTTLIVRRQLLAPTLLAACLALCAGCAGSSAARYGAQGSNCHAKALPSSGEGGLAFGPTLASASRKSLDSCMRYAGRSGGAPKTCKVVLARCKS